MKTAPTEEEMAELKEIATSRILREVKKDIEFEETWPNPLVDYDLKAVLRVRDEGEKK